MRNQNHINTLLTVLAEAKLRNPSFSLRGLARRVGVSPTHLSHLINGKRPLTRKTAERLADGLGLSPEERATFCTSVDNQSRTSTNGTTAPTRTLLSAETFHLISDWYHSAILALADYPENKIDPAWVAQQLGISEAAANLGLNRLIKLNLIKPRGRGFRQVQVGGLTTTRDVPSAAIRSYHSQLLEKARDAVCTQDTLRRYFGVLNLLICPEDLDSARKDLSKMLATFEKKYGRKPDVRKPYFLSVQLFHANTRDPLP